MKAIIMAAGKGTRLQGDGVALPKVLRRANGDTLIGHVLKTIDYIAPEDIIIVTGYMHEKVEAEYSGRGYKLVRQGDDGYGTGYAVMCAYKEAGLESFDGDVLVLNGDSPLIKKSTVQGLIKMHQDEGNAATILSCVSVNPHPFGRVLRDENGKMYAIREQKECTPEEAACRELNIGLYIFDSKKLGTALSQINCNNNAGEYYLTDVPPALIASGEAVNAFKTYDEDELWGVNTPEDLLSVERILKSR